MDTLTWDGYTQEMQERKSQQPLPSLARGTAHVHTGKSLFLPSFSCLSLSNIFPLNIILLIPFLTYFMHFPCFFCLGTHFPLFLKS